MNFYAMCCMLFTIRKHKNTLFKRTRAGPGIGKAKSNREDLSPLNIILAHRQGKR